MKLREKISSLSEDTKWKITIGVAALAVLTVIICAIGGVFHFEPMSLTAHDVEVSATETPNPDKEELKTEKPDKEKDKSNAKKPADITHTVFVSSGVGGKAYPSGNIKVDDADSLTLSFVPNEGYAIQSVTVDGAEVGAVETYTMEAIRGDHSIVVAFEELPEPEPTPIPTAEPTDETGENIVE